MKNVCQKQSLSIIHLPNQLRSVFSKDSYDVYLAYIHPLQPTSFVGKCFPDSGSRRHGGLQSVFPLRRETTLVAVSISPTPLKTSISFGR